MITLDLDTKALDREFTDLQRQQLPFAAALTANNLAKLAQKGVRESLSQNFTIAPDRLSFLQRTVRFDKANFATKANPAARMGIEQADQSYTSKDRSYLLGRHEEGGTRVASNPMEPFYLPAHALRAGAFDVAPRALYPRSLRIFERRTASKTLPGKSRITSGGKVQRIGNRRTFVIDARSTHDPRTWGIWQRTGPRREDIQMLWAFRTRITLTPRLHFYDVASRIVETNIDAVFAAALDRALRTAKP